MINLVQIEASVNTKIVTSEDGAKTFSITKTVEGIEGSHAYFILFYPTRTAKNCYIEDSTNNHLLNHLEELGLNGYTIINLFSKVTQSRLSLAELEVDEGNMEFIQEQVFSNRSDDAKVVIAWGNTQQGSPVIMKSKQRILELWEKERPSMIDFDGKNEEESVGSNEVHLNTCRGKGRQVGGGLAATVWKYWKRFTEWFSGLEWLELGIVPDGDSGYNG